MGSIGRDSSRTDFEPKDWVREGASPRGAGSQGDLAGPEGPSWFFQAGDGQGSLGTTLWRPSCPARGLETQGTWRSYSITAPSLHFKQPVLIEEQFIFLHLSNKHTDNPAHLHFQFSGENPFYHTKWREFHSEANQVNIQLSCAVSSFTTCWKIAG